MNDILAEIVCQKMGDYSDGAFAINFQKGTGRIRTTKISDRNELTVFNYHDGYILSCSEDDDAEKFHFADIFHITQDELNYVETISSDRMIRYVNLWFLLCIGIDTQVKVDKAVTEMRKRAEGCNISIGHYSQTKFVFIKIEGDFNLRFSYDDNHRCRSLDYRCVVSGKNGSVEVQNVLDISLAEIAIIDATFGNSIITEFMLIWRRYTSC